MNAILRAAAENHTAQAISGGYAPKTRSRTDPRVSKDDERNLKSDNFRTAPAVASIGGGGRPAQSYAGMF
jgi:hypothetical protein